jgi:hypothetical protein
MRIRALAPLAVGCWLLLGSACPTSDPFPRPPVSPPAISSLEITAIKTSDAYRAAVHIRWTLPQTDSSAIRELIILRKKQISDTVYGVFHYGIPDTIRDDYDVLDPQDFPGQGVYLKLWYRMFAIDTLGRPGDTSPPDSIRLCWTPRPGTPLDTLLKNQFKWYTIQYLAGYFTYMFLWSDTRGLIWTSPRSSEPSYGHETADSFFVRLPDSLYPLARGLYWYGAKIEFPGENIQTVAIQQFHAP